MNATIVLAASTADPPINGCPAPVHQHGVGLVGRAMIATQIDDLRQSEITDLRVRHTARPGQVSDLIALGSDCPADLHTRRLLLCLPHEIRLDRMPPRLRHAA